MYQRRGKTGKREGNWYISISGVRTSSGTPDRKKAQALEHKLNAESWDRAHGLIVPVWEQAVLSWMDDNPRQAGTYWAKKFLDFWKDHLKGKRLTDISPKVVHAIVGQHFSVDLVNPVGPNATANGYVGMVSRVIRHASNLNPKLTYYPKSQGRDRWLTVDEWHKLSAVMDHDLRDVSLFALVTGLREANVMGLRWEWVKGDWLEIPAALTKTRKPYGIPLNRTAQAVIGRRRAAVVQHPELVFLNAGKPWYRVMLCRAFRNAVVASGIPEITPHGLRHTFASWLAQKGVDRVIRDRLGCWAAASQGDKYSHFDVSSLRPFAELIDGILAISPQSQQIASA